MKTKHFLRLATALVLAGTFAACSDSKDAEKTDVELARESLAALAPTHVVVNQGNQADGIEGTLTAINYSTGATMQNVFAGVNGFALGDTPQNIFSRGARQYACVFGSNLVWVIDAQNLLATKQLSVSSPQRVIADDNWIYVASNDGYVTRFNAATFAEDAHISVGPNPMGLALANGDLYVSISDSYNWTNAMQDGKKVVRIDIATWKPEATIEVGLNPTRLEATSDGYVVCVCNGFFDSEQYVYSISPDNAPKMMGYGSDCVTVGTKAYATYAVTDWTTMKTTCTLSLFDPAKAVVEKKDLTGTPLDFSPTFLSYDATRQLLVIGRRAAGSDYTAAGSVEFRRTDGKLEKTFAVGVEPYSIVAL